MTVLTPVAIAATAVIAALAPPQGAEQLPTGLWEPISDTNAVDDYVHVPSILDLDPARVAIFRRLADCESGGDWSIDTSNGFYGGLQFTLASWVGVGGVGNPADATPDEQVFRGSLLQDKQGWGAWPACSRRQGLR